MTLSSRETHHALHVLRLRAADRVALLDGAGHELLCEVTESSREQVRLSVKQRNQIPPLPYQFTLIQAVAKGKAMETIVQKATELGAARIVPVLSERVVPQLDAENSDSKLEKWQAIAIDAIKQSGSAWLPKIEKPMPLKEFLNRGEKFDMPLIASLRSDTRHPREVFKAFRAERGRAPRSVCVWIGPEGDFTPAEMSEIRASGALPITLGPLILRSETAAIYCLSILNYELQSPSLD